MSLLNKKRAKQMWNKHEDDIVINWVKVNGEEKWVECSKILKSRTNKQIRERWMYVLSPSSHKKEWTEIEDYILYKVYKIYGSTWCLYSKYFIGRTQIAIKNRFYNLLRSSIREITKKSIKTILDYSKEELMIYFNEVYERKTKDIDEKLMKGGYFFKDSNFNFKYLNEFYTKTIQGKNNTSSLQSIDLNYEKRIFHIKKEMKNRICVENHKFSYESLTRKCFNENESYYDIDHTAIKTNSSKENSSERLLRIDTDVDNLFTSYDYEMKDDNNLSHIITDLNILENMLRFNSINNFYNNMSFNSE